MPTTVVVKKTFRYPNAFLLQTLMPPFLISEHKYEKRYKIERIGYQFGFA